MHEERGGERLIERLGSSSFIVHRSSLDACGPNGGEDAAAERERKLESKTRCS